MEKFKIAVGTKSKIKIKYLNEVLKELKVDFDLISVDVKSGVAEQPKTTKETERGSINRANGAFVKTRDVNFAIGIEIGYHKESFDSSQGKQNGYEMFCWVTIIDKNGYQISNQSHKFLLPKYYQDVLNNDLEISDNLNGYLETKKESNYIEKYIDEIIRYRKPFIESALKNALIRYLNKEDF